MRRALRTWSASSEDGAWLETEAGSKGGPGFRTIESYHANLPRLLRRCCGFAHIVRGYSAGVGGRNCPATGDPRDPGVIGIRRPTYRARDRRRVERGAQQPVGLLAVPVRNV